RRISRELAITPPRMRSAECGMRNKPRGLQYRQLARVAAYSAFRTPHSSLAEACGLLVLLDGRGEGGVELVGQHLLLADLLQDLRVRGAQELVQPLLKLLDPLDRH